MKTYLSAGLALIALAAPALATPALAAEHFAVVDTVGTCSVIDIKPGPHSGLRLLGDKRGYANVADAKKALKSVGAKCKAIIDRA
jgi:hypothetical protein